LNFQDLLLAIPGVLGEAAVRAPAAFDMEVGAGTMAPDTFFRVLGPEPWRVAYCQPSRRPGDGRFGENPMRVYKHYQFQVILSGAARRAGSVSGFPARVRRDPLEHDIRFEEDNWESPTLGPRGGLAGGDGRMEISQFTYFQQAGGHELAPVSRS